MAELQIEHYHCGCGSIITIYGSGKTYFKKDTYEEIKDEEDTAAI